MRGLSARVVAVLGMVAVIWGLAGPAYADGVIAPDKADVSDGNPPTVSLTLANPSDKSVDLSLSVDGSPNCHPKATPAAVPPMTSVTAKIALPKGCDITVTHQLRLDSGPRTVTLTPPEPSFDGGTILKGSAWIAGIVSSICLAWIYGSLLNLNAGHKTDERRQAALAQRDHILTSLKRSGVAVNEAKLDKAVTDAERVKTAWSTPLAGLDMTWSFKDSWLTNVNVGMVGLVTVVSTAGLLEALVSPKVKVLTSFLLIPAAITGVLVALATAAVKAFGSQTKTTTVGGFLVATHLALFASVFNLAANAGALLASLKNQAGVEWGIFIATAAGVLMAGKYVIVGARETFTKGLLPASNARSEMFDAAWMLMRPSPGRAPDYLAPDPAQVRAWAREYALDAPEGTAPTPKATPSALASIYRVWNAADSGWDHMPRRAALL